MAVLSSVVFGVVLCCSWVSAHVVYPEGEECPDSTCFTLQHYLINSSHYFTDNSIFLFRPGSHYLNSSLQVNHVENVTLKAEGTGAVVINISLLGTLNLNNTHKMNLIGLVIKYDTTSNQGPNAVILSNSNLLTISHCRFEVKMGLNLNLSRSLGNISDCSFLYGSVSIVSSIIQFKNITFYKMFSFNETFTFESSQIKFFEGLFFTDNEDGMTVKNSRIITQGVASFVNNCFTALSLINSTFEATGELIFNGNQDGYDGGAISFDADSRLRVNAPLNASFINNSATQYGGALFVDDSDFTTFTECRRSYTSDTPSQPCFIELGSETNSTSFKNIHIDFKDNTAVAGSLLYGGALKSCKVESNGILQNITGYQFLKNVSTISQTETISSSPLNLCICSCEGYHDCIEYYPAITVIPGEKFNVTIAAMGQFNSTPADIGVTVTSYKRKSHLILPNGNSLEVGCNNVTFQVYSYLDSDDFIGSVYPNGCTKAYIAIDIHIEKCPTGFILIRDTCGCENGLQELDNIVCDVQSRLIENSGTYWISPSYYNNTYTGFVWRNRCPVGYCNNNNLTHPSHIDFTTGEGRDSQCVTHRTGILCGACEKGYSLTLSSLECKKCSNKFLGLVLVFIVAGIGLIALLLALHMTVASGTLNGVILYANIVNVHANYFTLREGDFKMKFLTIVISWLNLDFGVPLCLYDELDAYQYSWLQYAFPLYLWFLTGFIIISCKYLNSMRRLLGSNPVAVLATVILMSFTKILQTTVEGLNYINLNSSNRTLAKKVWISDGNIEYFAGKHIILAATGICVIAFLLIPYTVLLLFGYQLQAYSDRKGFRWFNQIIPLLDAYYAPYKKNTRYWPGLMVVMRIGLFLSYILLSDNMMIIISVLSLTSVAIYLKLYKSIYLDLLEVSFALNLCVLCAGTYHVKLYRGNQNILSCICIGIALLELCGIIMFHLYTRFNCSKLFTRLPGIKFILKKYHKKIEIVPVVHHSNFDDYREPLLGSHQKTSVPRYST